MSPEGGVVIVALIGLGCSILVLAREIKRMSQAIAEKIAALQADVTAQTAVTQSAVTLLGGLKQQLDDAIAAAGEAGATPEQLAALTELSSSIEANTSSLAAAVQANTPAAPAP